VREVAIAIEGELPGPAERRGDAERLLGETVEEARLLGRGSAQPVAQTVDRLVAAVERAEVEEDDGVEQGLGLGLAQPGLGSACATRPRSDTNRGCRP
jgi:hypothetical protein